MDTLDVKLLRRSLGQKRTHQSVKGLHGDKTWVTDLDIVNELGGHTGCVNALSWSTQGNLLASGSDDTYLNIWGYNPANTAQPFTLNTSVNTGHHGNIFSVKFMPHSGDRTVVTCAADSQVRIFDLEYGGADNSGTDTTASTRSRRFNTFFNNARWLNPSNTNAKVYRSHSDRAKRIVTESSPYLFLSCSDDGDVRQWDLRQPSSAYPSLFETRRRDRTRTTSNMDEVAGSVPPALISYKTYGLDLNTISCSPSQPHYIALGGAHLHCFLHDRRMLGRDVSAEAGQPGRRNPAPETGSDEAMREATKCVRRFAPNNKRKMRPGLRNSGHITACKISDARPNELIASWSSDHIYSFDIVKSPDARDAEIHRDRGWQDTRLRDQSDRKRKRLAKSEASQGNTAESSQTMRKVADETEENGHTALRVRRDDGNTEDTAISQGTEHASLDIHESLLTEAQKQAGRVAKLLVRLRKTLFDFSTAPRDEQIAEMEGLSELTPFTANFTNALGQASALLPEMEEIMRTWSYPLNPDPEEVELQNTLRRNRQSTWRFVQAAGVLSKVLGGQLVTMNAVPDPRLEGFDMIRPAPREVITDEAKFYYDFLKAICLWLDGGASAVLNGFRISPRGLHQTVTRFFLDDEDNVSTMTDKLKSSLFSLADEDRPVFDLEANRFLVAEERSVFRSQQQAVNAFIRALAGIELRMHQGLSEPGIYSSGTSKRVMDKGAAARFWGAKVGRSLLMEAARGVNFAFVQQAFGGTSLRIVSGSDLSSIEDQEETVEALDLIAENIAASTTSRSAVVAGEPDDTDVAMNTPALSVIDAVEEAGEDEIIMPLDSELNQEDSDNDDSGDDEADEDDGNDEDDENDDQDNDSDDSEGEMRFSFHRSRLNVGHPRHRATVNIDVPYTSHTRRYKGHCNSKTVKDVNYYGPNDEYIVSGSDDGHFFIWDRKTSRILNILEGDGEVVNVVQGHPYEPTIACSGIDSTIKIFGPGGNSRERYRAARGLDVANPGGSVHSSLRYGARPRRAAPAESDDGEDEDGSRDQPEVDVEEGQEERVLRKGLKSRKAIHKQYEIMSQNDAERTRGIEDITITDAMLARVAAALQHRHMQGIGGLPDITDATGGTIVVDQDNCSVM